MKKPKLSLIIPVYNEEKLIQRNLDKITKYLSKQKYSWEIVVVNDGSTDKTLEMVNYYKKSQNISNSQFRVLNLKLNMGKGAALKKGFLQSRGIYRIFTDADLSVDIEKLEQALRKLEEGADVVIGSRRIRYASIDIPQPMPRQLMGRVFTKLTQIITNTKLSDYTCGFKVFSQNAAEKVFSKALINRWAYDAEILFLAHKYGYKIVEIPVNWKNRKETKVKLVDAIFTSFRDLLLIRYYNSSGRYEK